jgi:hypothetical protein
MFGPLIRRYSMARRTVTLLLVGLLTLGLAFMGCKKKEAPKAGPPTPTTGPTKPATQPA